MQQDEHFNYTHARTEEQRTLMARIHKDGVCPFCWEHFEQYHPKPIEDKTDWWLVTENVSPYEGTSLHLLFVYKEHVVLPTEVTRDGWADLHAVMQRALTRHEKQFGAFFMRFGEMSATGASVAHLHAHLIAGKEYAESSGEKIRVKLGYR
jgi:ATP adenylyltransferase